MEKSLETLRHSQAKLAELERINKKINSQSHEDKKELFKLKEVYNCVTTYDGTEWIAMHKLCCCVFVGM